MEERQHPEQTKEDYHDFLQEGRNRHRCRAVAVRLSRDGFPIGCLDYNAETAEAAADVIIATGGEALTFAFLH